MLRCACAQKLGIGGGNLKGYGCQGLSIVGAGMAAIELVRVLGLCFDVACWLKCVAAEAGPGDLLHSWDGVTSRRGIVVAHMVPLTHGHPALPFLPFQGRVDGSCSTFFLVHSFLATLTGEGSAHLAGCRVLPATSC